MCHISPHYVDIINNEMRLVFLSKKKMVKECGDGQITKSNV